MLHGKSFVGMIPARSGSKRVKNKNMKLMGGKPLIQWTLDAAMGSQWLDAVHVSTDSSEIQTFAQSCGAKAGFLRPDSLSTDQASSVDVVLDFLEREPNFDFLVLLQPTSPLRKSTHIDEGIERILRLDGKSLVTVRPSQEHPEHLFCLDDQNQRMKKRYEGSLLQRTQDLEKLHAINGALYIVHTETFKKRKTFVDAETIPQIMTLEESIDIDTEYDFGLAEYLRRTNER